MISKPGAAVAVAAAASALALLLTACTSASRQEKAVIERHVRFVCDNKESVELRFFPQQGVAVLVRHGRTIELQQQKAASGFVYSNGPNTVRGKGDEITVEVGRMVPLRCTAIKPGAAGMHETTAAAALERS